MRHLLTVADLSTAEIQRVFAITEDLKSKYEQGIREPLLPGRVAALLFQHPSLRTRVSFEVAMAHLGGSSLFLSDDVGFGTRESIADFARVLGQYVDVVVVRAKKHTLVEELARHCQASVINGLTDYAHPCQALADLYTLRERIGTLQGHTLAFVGDGNNVSRSLAMACGRLGMRFVLAAPRKYQFDKTYLKTLQREVPQMQCVLTEDPAEAVRDATVVYTDVWTSMGQEAENARRRQEFAAYQVNAQLMRHAPRDAVFMHNLPAHRGEEVTDEVIDGPQSIVIPQAANRLHAQKGILVWLLAAQG
jgi:ornithine carbamoyltransferase